MAATLSVFSLDRAHKWMLAPDVASTRQIELRNDSSDPIECHLTVEEPSAASASPAVLSVPARHTRTADIIFLANWSPERDRRVVLSARDGRGNLLTKFELEIGAVDSSDCNVVLNWKEEIVLNGTLAGFKLTCAITNRSESPRTFELEFSPHPALRFPDRKQVTLAAAASAIFEIPIEWNRSVRDAHGWNHPRVIEVSVPVTQGRRTAVLLWAAIEHNLAPYLTNADRVGQFTSEAGPEPVAMLPGEAAAASARPNFLSKSPGQSKYEELLEIRKLEEGVVGPVPVRKSITPLDTQPARESFLRRMPPATLAITGIAVAAVALAGLYFTRTPSPPAQSAAPFHVTPLALGSTTKQHASRPAQQNVSHVASPAAVTATAVRQENQAVAAVLASTEGSTQPTSASQSGTVAAKRPAQHSAPARVASEPHAAPARPAAPVDRSAAVVALADPQVSYASGGRAVSVDWNISSQSAAVVQLLDDRGKIIGHTSVRGSNNHALVRLPRGYHGPVYVEVIARGFHGERVVQSASLTSPNG